MGGCCPDDRTIGRGFSAESDEPVFFDIVCFLSICSLRAARQMNSPVNASSDRANDGPRQVLFED